MRGGRRLWQSRDERKWGHDKYEEMNTHAKQYDVVILYPLSLSFSLKYICIFDIFPLAVFTHLPPFFFLLIQKLIDKIL